jgi:hypothetical protein
MEPGRRGIDCARPGRLAAGKRGAAAFAERDSARGPQRTTVERARTRIKQLRKTAKIVPEPS